MDMTYRFRFLIYVAAFMLVMSLCFVYAEPLPSQNHLLFQVAPQYAGFQVPTSRQPVFDSSALRSATPVISPQVLDQLEDGTRGHRGFFHRAKRAARPAAANLQSTSSVLGLTAVSPMAVPGTR